MATKQLPEYPSAKNSKLVKELSALIDESRGSMITYANTSLTLLFWKVGKRIQDEILKNQRAAYGQQIVPLVSQKLQAQYGKNFEEKNLRRMMQLAITFPEAEKVVMLAQQLSWSHFLTLLPIKIENGRNYYAERAFQEKWGVRQLRDAIARKEFERTGLVKKPAFRALSPSEQAHFKDPYIFDFLGLPSGFLEKDLESAILRDLEKFMLEMGQGFAFISRQKRMIIDGDDCYLDLLFFHRKLRRLVAIDLKIGKFQARDKGQMELYLKWLDKYDRLDCEEKPVGLILCTETSNEQIELLEIEKDGIMVAEYWTELPSRKAMEKELKSAYNRAKEEIEKNHS